MKYRYTLEKYRGIRSRYTCPQCGRKYVFTRYIDTETNQYIADDVGKCNRLDKCGYHYTPKQYFSDNSWREPVRSVFYIGKKTEKQEQKPSFLPEQLYGGARKGVGHCRHHLATARIQTKAFIEFCPESAQAVRRAVLPSSQTE